MTYVSKFRSAGGTVTAVYTCPEHGEFDAEVQREPNGDAPDSIPCPETGAGFENVAAFQVPTCGLDATWTPSASVGCRVRRVEVVRGGWEKPERKTYLDTRKLGEGQSTDEFQAERKKIWDEQRRKRVKELLR